MVNALLKDVDTPFNVSLRSAGRLSRYPSVYRSQAYRHHDAGVHLRPRLGPANSLSAVRVRGRRAVVKDGPKGQNKISHACRWSSEAESSDLKNIW